MESLLNSKEIEFQMHMVTTLILKITMPSKEARPEKSMHFFVV
jgi:hypothetical protein